jgi:GNAT superfamily N-acetyltransferase
LVELLGRLSPESAYQRFLTALAVPPPAWILDALLPDGAQGGAVLALCGHAAVGHGVWRQLGPTPVAEIGVVVSDRLQRKGVGSDIVEMLISDLSARGMRCIHVLTSGTNRAVIRMISEHAPTASRRDERGTATFRFPTEVYASKSGRPKPSEGA